MSREELEKRKKVVYELICSEFYVPMKLKEMAIFMEIPKEQREELSEVLETLLLEGKIEVSQKGKYQKNDTIMYVSSGIGTEKINFRFLNPPSFHLYRIYNYN